MQILAIYNQRILFHPFFLSCSFLVIYREKINARKTRIGNSRKLCSKGSNLPLNYDFKPVCAASKYPCFLSCSSWCDPLHRSFFKSSHQYLLFSMMFSFLIRFVVVFSFRVFSYTSRRLFFLPIFHVRLVNRTHCTRSRKVPQISYTLSKVGCYSQSKTW